MFTVTQKWSSQFCCACRWQMRVTKATLEVINASHGTGESVSDGYHCSNVVQVGKGSAVQTQWWDMIEICNREIMRSYTHNIRQHKANPILRFFFWNSNILESFLTHTGLKYFVRNCCNILPVATFFLPFYKLYETFFIKYYRTFQ